MIRILSIPFNDNYSKLKQKMRVTVINVSNIVSVQ